MDLVALGESAAGTPSTCSIAPNMPNAKLKTTTEFIINDMLRMRSVGSDRTGGLPCDGTGGSLW